MLKVGYIYHAPDAPTPPRDAPGEEPPALPEMSPALSVRLDEYFRTVSDEQLRKDLDAAAFDAWNRIGRVIDTERASSPTVQQAALSAAQEIAAWEPSNGAANCVEIYEYEMAQIIQQHIAHLTASSAEDTAIVDWLEKNSRLIYSHCSQWRDGVRLSGYIETDAHFRVPWPENTPASTEHGTLRDLIRDARASTSKGAV